MKNRKHSVCQKIKAGGSQCEASALTGSRFCYFHDPSKAHERQVAQRAGGLARSRQCAVLPRETPDRQVRKICDVVEVLGETLNQVRRGQIDPKVANSVAYIAGILLKALERGPLEERIASLEEILKKPPSQGEPLLGSGKLDRTFSFETRSTEENDGKKQ
jgi:molybdopterin/thiamine biosynthesis adenylyltransferase